MAFIPTPGGVHNTLNITAPVVIKATPGNIVTVTITNSGSGGALEINDCATLGAATAANTIINLAYTSLTQPVINFNWFVTITGIVISAVPTGSIISIAYA